MQERMMNEYRAAEVNQDFEDAVNGMICAAANEADQQSGAVSEEDPQVEVSTQQEAAGSEQSAKKTVLRKEGIEERWIRKSL